MGSGLFFVFFSDHSYHFPGGGGLPHKSVGGARFFWFEPPPPGNSSLALYPVAFYWGSMDISWNRKL